jgi:hypothetical protein
MRRVLSLVCLLGIAGCDWPVSTLVPGAVPSTSSAGNNVVAAYAATVTASATCASDLPAQARERTYIATLLPGGNIRWTGPTLKPPPGHSPISQASIQGASFSLSIDVERDPQSDAFHGLWDMGDGTFLNISGKGTGTVQGDEITGRLNGVISYYEPVTPPTPGILITGRYCQAADHTFRFVRQ